MFEIPTDWLDTVIRLVSATVLTAVIGFEREVRDKPAGLRTHMLVGLGSAACCVFAVDLIEASGETNGPVSFDPLRIIEGVVGGLGFLGAGAIIQSRGEVHGMTSAVGIWICGAIGVGCGLGNYFGVAVVTVITVICLIPVRVIEQKLKIRDEHSENSSSTEDG